MPTPPLVFQDVIDLLDTAVDRSDVSPKYMDFINRAVRDVAAAHSFDQMSKSGSVTLAINTAQIALPADFKDLQPGRFPVFAAIGNASAVKVPVFRKDEIERLQGQFMPLVHLIYTSDDNAFQLGLIPPNVALANWVITLYYFAYPEVVTDPDVGTPLLTFYPNLIIAKTLSLIFQSLNDPIWEEHEKSYQVQLAQFTGADIRISNIKAVPAEKA